MKDYHSKVSRSDGIDADEAVVLAKSEMVFRGWDKTYHLSQPRIEAVDQEHWGIRFYPVNKTAKDVVRNPSVLVIIRKNDGQVFLNTQGTSYMFLE